MESLEEKLKRLEIALNNLKGVFLDKLKSTDNEDSIYNTNVKIVSHLDADGLSAAAILALTLKKENIGFSVSIVKQLQKSNIQSITADVKKNNQIVIFTDLGSGQQHVIEKFINPTEYIILDHHKPEQIDDDDKIHKINHVNSHFYGIDGSSDISGAGMCYLFSKTFNEKNREFASLAIIGAIGDVQNKGKMGTFTGINEYILEDAINFGKITKEPNLNMSRTKSLTYALAYTLSEKLPGLYEDLHQAALILKNTGIKITTELNKERALIDLSERERTNLTREIIQYALQNGADSSITNTVFTTHYLLTDFNKINEMADAMEMSRVLNACGRSGKYSLALSLLMGDTTVIDDCINIRKEHGIFLKKAIEWGHNHYTSYDYINVLDATGTIEDTKISTIASILCHKKGLTDKPFIAYTDSDDDSLKISARIHQSLVDLGLDLAEILKNVHDKMFSSNYLSGGHTPAAGGYIPADKIKAYLDNINSVVAEKLTDTVE